MSPVRFVADVGANHDGDLCRALRLIRLAAEAGANVVKFQAFTVEGLISPEGFAALPPMAHQKSWSKSVVDTYRDAELPMEWVPILAKECALRGVDFGCTPYSLEAVDALSPFVKEWKIGSGDITYRALLEAVAKTGKPVLLATGASTADEVQVALNILALSGCGHVTVMQCNTDYSGGNPAASNLRWLELRYTQFFHARGLSDHTKSLPVVLGAVALGATVIERHFRGGSYEDGHGNSPDMAFSMDRREWRVMVDAVRELESAMGDGIKKVESNEVESRIVQRRCWRAARDLMPGHVIQPGDVIALRPCPEGALTPMTNVVGWRVVPGGAIKQGVALRQGEALQDWGYACCVGPLLPSVAVTCVNSLPCT